MESTTSPSQPRLLIVDDEKGNIDSLRLIFQREQCEVSTASSGKEALSHLRAQEFDLVITDMMMPNMDGLQLLRAIKAMAPHTQVITVTAYGSIEKAVEAMRQGAYDFITKPLKRREIVKVVNKALERGALLQENARLRQQLHHAQQPTIVGQSAALRRTLDIAKQAAPSLASVLIHGENGTGKELIARELHRQSPRHNKPLVDLNCAAFPETLIESELFGHKKGTFTGAHADKPGRFERAHRGTLFLDEIGELQPHVQIKLLRVLSSRQVQRLGELEPRPIDIRLISATNRDLRQEIAKGRFREDLFYRLNVIEIHVPPLRERQEDIPLLANHFLQHYAAQNQRPAPILQAETLEQLQHYNWPGNVRQLENVMHRAAVLSQNQQITPQDLPSEIHHSHIQG
ncbi:MAG: sigma-54 dependent transcriptional regulator, partial [Myxococcota bacterium]